MTSIEILVERESLAASTMTLAELAVWLKARGWRGHANGWGRRSEQQARRFLSPDGRTLALISYDGQGHKTIWIKEDAVTI